MVRAVSTDPMTATPSAPPSWRAVVLVPLATPLLFAGTSDITMLVS